MPHDRAATGEARPDHSAELAYRLREATRRLVLAHRALDDARRPCGAPLSTANAWAFLELRQRGPMSITALASLLGIDRTNVSRLCARMESRGELLRLPDPHDKRARIVRLTESGREIARTLDAASTAHFQEILGELAVDAAAAVFVIRSVAEAMHAKTEISSRLPHLRSTKDQAI